MGASLVRGVLGSGLLPADQVTVADVDGAKRRELAERYGVHETRDNAEAATRSQVTVLAVKPRQVRQVLEEMAPKLTPGHTIISIAAGVKLSSLAEVVRPDVNLVRVMPNSPALVGQAVSAIAPAPGTGEDAVSKAKAIFGAVGDTVEIPEELLDAVTAVSGSGPAYFYLFVEALTNAAVDLGLPREIAQRLSVGTLVGSGAMLRETGKHPAVLRDMVTSPGGTTIAALAEFESKGLRGAVWQGVWAAYRRAKELG